MHFLWQETKNLKLYAHARLGSIFKYIYLALKKIRRVRHMHVRMYKSRRFGIKHEMRSTPGNDAVMQVGTS